MSFWVFVYLIFWKSSLEFLQCVALSTCHHFELKTVNKAVCIAKYLLKINSKSFKTYKTLRI